ncbi:predicted protein [Aspergillus terreus NIH2624]|uniref:Uncharacterized protein n=1 Tax=Aspergillus terreus (strain NIH 2624 / FGSC A1156) TaxID=341663 RepID=Q0CES7_ASPTN|nr:uncharacterized protein ATEG_07807 [Aspergillus terreus NIH2624]EAU32069.1 predicted protein [Aspergillus terreus NIH2624]
MMYLRQILTLALVTCAYARPVAHEEMASALSSKDHTSLTGSDEGHEGVMRQGGLEPAPIGQSNDNPDGGYVGAYERDYVVNSPDGGYEGQGGDGWRKTDIPSASNAAGGYEGRTGGKSALEPAPIGQPKDNPDGGYVGAYERDYVVNSPDGGYEGQGGDGWRKTDIPAVSNPEGGHVGDEGFHKGDVPAVSNPDGGSSNPDGGYVGQGAGY